MGTKANNNKTTTKGKGKNNMKNTETIGRIIYYTVGVIAILFLAWFILSFFDVQRGHMSGEYTYAWWNLFQIFIWS